MPLNTALKLTQKLHCTKTMNYIIRFKAVAYQPLSMCSEAASKPESDQIKSYEKIFKNRKS